MKFHLNQIFSSTNSLDSIDLYANTDLSKKVFLSKIQIHIIQFVELLAKVTLLLYHLSSFTSIHEVPLFESKTLSIHGFIINFHTFIFTQIIKIAIEEQEEEKIDDFLYFNTRALSKHNLKREKIIKKKKKKTLIIINLD